jgi:hypothetical protein
MIVKKSFERNQIWTKRNLKHYPDITHSLLAISNIKFNSDFVKRKKTVIYN